MRRLHRVGNCFRVPGVHYFRYESYGEDLPPPEKYDWVCLDCWPMVKGGGDSDEEVGEVSSSSGSTEEDSDQQE